MFKKICTLVVILLTLSMSSQNATLLKNFNPKAKELKHSLNYTQDSLLMDCGKTIQKVEIFNEDFEKIIIVEDFEVKIPLHDIPVGEFVVEARLEDKIIAMNLIKYNYGKSNSLRLDNKNEIAEGIGMMLDEDFNVIKSSPKNSIEFILTGAKAKKRPSKNQKFFWTITIVNNESGSSKTMKLVDQESVNRMILKNKLENDSALGKSNALIVWEVYNTSKFMEYQLSNPNFVYSSKSDVFNPSPYYSSETSSQNL